MKILFYLDNSYFRRYYSCVPQWFEKLQSQSMCNFTVNYSEHMGSPEKSHVN